jgi:DNA-binding response OmpR family regulator
VRILIVEDEALLALELEYELEAAGHEVVGQAMNSRAARDVIDRDHPDFAFVDIHLTDGPTGIDVGRYLAEHQIPYVFVSGNIKRIPDDFAGAIAAIEKPYTMNGLQNALSFIARVLDGDETAAPPCSLVMAPGRSAVTSAPVTFD